MSIVLIPFPTAAARLLTWKFDPQANRLQIETDTAIQPTAQLVLNPTRVVIDLPGIQLGQPKINQPINETIKAVRLAQFTPDTTRLVIELTEGYSLDPAKITIQSSSRNHWAVKLPQPQLLTNQPGSPALTTPADPIPLNVITPLTPPRFNLNNSSAQPVSSPATAGQPLTWLQQRLAGYRKTYPAFQSGMFFLDMDNGNYVDLNGDKIFPAASIIKLPILVAFFQAVDAGKVRLDEKLTLRPELFASGSGEMQFQRPWTQFSAQYTAAQMIIISDNTATNLILKRLGGPGVLNQQFRSWGLKQTVIRNWLPDLSGTNTTTARELVNLLTLLDQGKLLTPSSWEKALAILRQTKNRKLLAAGLGPGAVFAHKTGDIGFMLGDAGMIQMPTGKRYMAAVIAKTPYDDPAGWTFMREISKIAYTYFNQSRTGSLP